MLNYFDKNELSKSISYDKNSPNAYEDAYISFLTTQSNKETLHRFVFLRNHEGWRGKKLLQGMKSSII